MSTEKIRKEIEKVKTLLTLQKDLLKLQNISSENDIEIIKTKLSITHEELLKSTYTIGKLLTHLEEKV